MVCNLVKKALINIDYTVDFVADEGKLTCGKPGQELENYIADLTETFLQDGDFVALAIDAHTEGDTHHPESKLFPPHNIIGTAGRTLYGRLEEIYQTHHDNSLLYYFDKTRYSAFAGTDLELRLRERGIQEIHLVGVCTDICILHTAVDAYNKGFQIVVHESGVASFNQAGHEWALGHFKHTLGATIVS
ncbi:cysteine hydrolase [Ornithinibacillus gellani]|nr:cysteine hydrolase [Ornithinibacillus gellani]